VLHDRITEADGAAYVASGRVEPRGPAHVTDPPPPVAGRAVAEPAGAGVPPMVIGAVGDPATDRVHDEDRP
jgi:hypothetical protein